MSSSNSQSATTHSVTSSPGSGSIGDRIKGVFHTVHAAGELVRGSINDVLDAGGDIVGGRERGEVVSKNERNRNTVAKGKEELDRGLRELKGEHVPVSISAEPTVERPRTTSGSNSVFAAAENLRLSINSSIDRFGEGLVGSQTAPSAQYTTTHSEERPVQQSHEPVVTGWRGSTLPAARPLNADQELLGRPTSAATPALPPRTAPMQHLPAHEPATSAPVSQPAVPSTSIPLGQQTTSS